MTRSDNEFHLILTVNPGATSTKIGLFRGAAGAVVVADARSDPLDNLGHAATTDGVTVRHPDEVLAPFAHEPVLDQLPMRLEAVLEALRTTGHDVAELDAVAGRGGLLAPVQSGTYAVNRRMLDDLRLAARGEHASNLGAFLARDIAAAAGCPAFIVDPVSVDEWEPEARPSGLAGLDRSCLSHALNTKAVAKRYAHEKRRSYNELRLIVAHLGSGVSISAHRDGRMIDVSNPREEGPFSADRAGGLPVMQLLDLAFAPGASREELERRIFREGGVFSYLGTRDIADVGKRIDAGWEEGARVIAAMTYQIAREIGAMAAVLHGKVDAILLTGGMAHASRITRAIARRTGWIAPLHVYPGEDELRALAEGALRVLEGEEEAREYRGTENAS